MTGGSFSDLFTRPMQETKSGILTQDNTIVLPEQTTKLDIPKSDFRGLTKKGFDLQPSHVIKMWREKPLVLIRDAFNSMPEVWQEDCLELYLHNPRLGMIASKGVGKTWLLAVIIWHFFITRYIPKIAVLSISKDHLMANLWAELTKAQDQVPLFKLATDASRGRITLKGKEQYSFIDARSFAKSADANTQASTLAGLHSDNVMFAIDEAGAMPDAILETADAALSSGDGHMKCARLVVTANPEVPKGILYRASKGLEKSWKMYRISGDPDDPKRSPRVSKDWAQSLIDRYGREDPFVMINVLGKYPNVAVGGLFSEEDIDASMNRDLHPDEYRLSQTRLGVDVARDGSDRTCFFKRKGLKAFEPQDYPSNLHGPDIAGKVVFEAMGGNVPVNERPERIFIDDTGGYGGAVVDSLMFTTEDLDVTPVKYNASAQDKRYANKRTEMYLRLRDWVHRGGCLPKDARLKEELLAIEISFHNGVTKLIPKAMIRAKIGRSPDRSDSIAQTFADLDEITEVSSKNMSGTDEKFMRQFNQRRKSGHVSGQSGSSSDSLMGHLTRYL